MLFNHPHNPSGWVPEQGFLAQLHTLVDRWGGTLLGDEHYRFLVDDSARAQLPITTEQSGVGAFPLGPKLFQNDGKTVVTGSFIKCLGTPGLRVGWCVGPAELICKLQNLKNYTTHTVNPYSEWVSDLVLSDPSRAAFHAARRTWQRNRAALADWLSLNPCTKQPGHSWVSAVPAGGWVTCLAYGGGSGWRSSGSSRRGPGNHNVVSSLDEKGVFLLALADMEWQTFDTRSVYARLPSFRLGLGLEPELFEGLLRELRVL